jgi:hypothetical protein
VEGAASTPQLQVEGAVSTPQLQVEGAASTPQLRVEGAASTPQPQVEGAAPTPQLRVEGAASMECVHFIELLCTCCDTVHHTPQTGTIILGAYTLPVETGHSIRRQVMVTIPKVGYLLCPLSRLKRRRSYQLTSLTLCSTINILFRLFRRE